MSLTSDLEEIKGNITFSNEAINLNNNHIQIQDIVVSIPETKKYSINSIDSKTKERLINFLNLIVYNNTISSMNKVDKKIATEVFTMIPNISKETEAKLTSFPSLINKEIIEKVLNTELSNNISMDILEKLNSNISLLEEVKGKIEDLKNYLIEFTINLENKIEKLTKNPLLIVTRLNEPKKENDITIYSETLNVIESPISKLAYLHNNSLDYNKFRENKLPDKYYNIYSNTNLDILLNLCLHCNQYNKDLVSLKDINDIVKYIVFKELNNINKIIENYILELNRIKERKEINSGLLEIINLNEVIINKLEIVNKLNEIYLDSNNIFKEIEKLIEIF